MVKTGKKLGSVLCVMLAVALLLTGCSNGDGGVRDDVSVDDLAEAFEAEIEGSDGLVDPGAGYIAGSMKLDTEALGEYIIKISAYSTSINEYGVFKADSEEAAADLAQVIQDYLTMRNDTWMSEYLPEEYPKLENAQVKQLGLYVAYAILDEAERDAVFGAFSEQLAK